MASYLAELHDQGLARRRVAAGVASRALAGEPSPVGEGTGPVLAGSRRTADDRRPGGDRSGRLTWPPSSHLPTAAASRPWRRVRGNVALKRDRLAARRSTLRRVLERAAPGARPEPQASRPNGERRRCELLGVRGAASGRSTTWKGDGRGGISGSRPAAATWGGCCPAPHRPGELVTPRRRVPRARRPRRDDARAGPAR